MDLSSYYRVSKQFRSELQSVLFRASTFQIYLRDIKTIAQLFFPSQHYIQRLKVRCSLLYDQSEADFAINYQLHQLHRRISVLQYMFPQLKWLRFDFTMGVRHNDIPDGSIDVAFEGLTTLPGIPGATVHVTLFWFDPPMSVDDIQPILVKRLRDQQLQMILEVEGVSLEEALRRR